MSIIASHFDVFSGGAVTWKREKKNGFATK